MITYLRKVISNLSLGSSSSTAHRGDHGVSAYEHSLLEHADINATVNDTDANLRDRSTHTGTQAATTITEDATHRFVTDDEKTLWGLGGGLLLGETNVTAYRGDRGKTAYDHSQVAHAPSDAQKNSDILKAEIEAKLTGTISSHSHTVTKSDVGLGNVDNTSDASKPISTATQTALDAKQATLVSGTNIKTINGSTVLGSGDLVVSGSGGDLVYVPTAADVAINSITDVTIATRDVTGIAAGDQIILEGEIIILNNSTATRVYVITIDFDGAFDIEITTPALATSATLMHPFLFRAVCNVRSTSLAYAVVSIDMQLAAGVGAGGDTTMLATHLSGKGWGTTASNLTGTLTCAMFIRSANATATQTCRVVSFTIRKATPTV